ncbi:tRNA (5-methylaminomethyl-2-thiouridine)(34)-methyltransferase MnmD [Rhizobium rhizogenes]|uniref:5-methylaminomethyl-2-thiouridine methyltransferase n=1 Tax=Rhizobium rhizogenes TaxID=359 RepID=A0AA92C6P9_RHIRH|nr:tRNA (5-methylaminomethyl-2-thiouridine)(34)-methyltransferase MnmD [Rhizobium rhizogenes]PVE56940.1 5-methylaminomethyl-2-thiouridine methyltransferase [Rhizobium rhizogenes]PVE68550.1 5-methylaminomethyl-2-thiouridine methyltransferase [Agrobacterium tumefaciens]PVE78298.1 5-methylaminomethyl-2-thiouridine methyltransferase [Sphingomonas sp. TPD3009]
MTHPEDARPDSTGNNMLDWREGDMPYSLAFGDHFYCQTEGRLECEHVSLNGNGLPDRWEDHPKETFVIGELGFGTALNLTETWRQWKLARKPGKTLHFVSFELYPMRAAEIDRALSRWPEVNTERQALVSLWPEEPHGMVELQLDEQTKLTVVCGEALQGIKQSDLVFDAWYLDGFAPARNPDMWSVEIMSAIYDKTQERGTFATYAAAGFVRRNLQSAGFAVERRKGFAGKREMLCGTKQVR